MPNPPEAPVSNEKLFQVLKEMKVIRQADLEEALRIATEEDLWLGDVLFEKGLISDRELGILVADFKHLPFVDLAQGDVIKPEALDWVSFEAVKRQRAVVFDQTDEFIKVATNKPDNEEFFKLLEKKFGKKVKLYWATKRGIQRVLRMYGGKAEERFKELLAKAENVTDVSEDFPIIDFVREVLRYAQNEMVSDVHVEPTKEYGMIRFRIDGVLHEIVRYPMSLHERIVMRIKVMASLKTDDHLHPQDGKISLELEGGDLDIRVSIVPLTHGEKVVMRLLSVKSRQFSLSQLGMNEMNMKRLKKAYNAPYGMLLVTGPTGSGKTTTLYAVLKILNKREVNIMTIEDPVEYEIVGINQIQVNEQTGLSFADGLRSIVRQDPDVIFVGEIRDEETAKIAVNSAMTGHLVLSTLHTNTAAGAIPRLMDMGVEPFLVASSIHTIIAQRLVRKICDACKVSEEISRAELEGKVKPEVLDKLFEGKKTLRVYKGKGCQACHGTGYHDRLGIFEVLEMNETIKDAIIEKADADELAELAIKQGMKTMLDDGIEKIKLGITTLEEVLRVTED